MKYYLRVLSTITFFSFTLLNAQCTQEESFNMMLALQPVGQQWSQKVRAMANEDPKRVTLLTKLTNFNNEMAEVGIMARDGKYTEACAGYKNIASKYGLNLEKLIQTSPTIASLQQSGNDQKCSLSDASIKLVDLIAAAPLELTKKEEKIFNKIQISISTNPAEACKDMDKLIKKYSIQMQEPN